nr:MAG TPA: YokU-like protein [Caudoviricetes sp.]
MKRLFCPNCNSTSSVHHHTDWRHIDNSTGQSEPVSVVLCLDCKTLFIDDRSW